MRRLLMLCCVLMLAGCAGLGLLEKPQVALAGMELDEIGLFEQRFLVTLRVSNPNAQSVTVDGVEFSLDLNGEPFASGLSGGKVTLPARGDALVRVTVATSLGRMWKQLRSLQSLDKPLPYRMTGKLYTPWIPGGMPFEKTGELPALNQVLPDLPGKQERPVEKL